jgi:dimeric dUTPase (all-alpha-NTP-PPase superfamily)
MTDDSAPETYTPVLFGAWLEEMRKLQEGSFGFDFEAMAADKAAHADYLRTMALAAMAELSEMLEEVRWKPWASGDGPVVPDRRAVVKEAVDALHFIGNFLVAVGASTGEVNREYLGKMQVNRERQAREGGYQSRAGEDKCPRCRRSFDDVGKGIVQVDGEDVCSKCVDEVLGRVAL